MLNFVADKKERLDKFLAERIPFVSRGRIQKVIKNGLVKVNNLVVKETDYRLQAEDAVELPEFQNEKLSPANIELKIVFENNDLAVIDKPAGLVVHPGAGHKEDTLANALLNRFPGIENVGDPKRPGIVHRLDEDTSGLILIAKTPKAYEYLKNLFLERKIEKEYLTLVHGLVEQQHGIIDTPLEKAPTHMKMFVGKGKEAVTEYFHLADNSKDFSLLRIKLHTGRTHQIRAHMAHIGHSILGDQVYGGHFMKKDVELLSRQFLHAHRLKFQDLNGTWLEFFSPLPPELKDCLNKLNIVIPDSIRNPETGS